MGSPYSLCDKRGPDKSDATKFHFDKDIGRWAGYSPFSICDGNSIHPYFLCSLTFQLPEEVLNLITMDLISVGRKV